MKLSILLATSVLLISAAFPLPCYSKDGAELAADGLKLFQKQKYAEAFKLLSAAEKTRSVDPSLEYYLGVSALYSKNSAAAKTALSRCVVLSLPNNPFHKQSLALLNQHFRVQPYNCRATAIKSHSWSKSAMPIRIFISDGKMLPQAFRTECISGEQVRQVTKWATNPSFVSRLEVCPGYRSAYKQRIQSGAQMWAWAAREGILSFQFVQSAANADILVFFYPVPQVKHSGGHSEANGLPKDATIVQMKLPSVFVSPEEEKEYNDDLIVTAAHEFGHSWGLYHSEDEDDLMFHMATGEKGITENDKQSLRAVYAGKNELTHLSVGK